MTRLTFGTGALAGAAVAAVMVVPLVAADHEYEHPTDDLQRPGCTSIECQLLPSEEALRLESRLERRGYVCTGKARLSDAVVVDLDAGARLLPFDEAMGIGSRGTGWMRSYCSQP